MSQSVLVIPDLQIPFHHKDALRFLQKVYKTFAINEVVCIGDEVDFHALSDYDHDPDGYSPGDELRKAIEELQPFYKAFPKVKVVTSNHTDRIYRRAKRFGIPRAFLNSYAEFLQAPPGWHWEEYYIIDGVRYEHGHKIPGGDKLSIQKAPLLNGRSTVFGHFHSSAGIQYTSSPEALLFGFNAGCLIDFKSYAFDYAKARPILGCGIVEAGIPTFIPMLLNKRGRWIGGLKG